jgi:hypothetical protein
LPGKIEHSTPTGFPEHHEPGAPQAEPNVEEAQAITASKNLVEEKDKEAAKNFKKCTGAAAQGGKLDTPNASFTKNARRMLPMPLLSHEKIKLIVEQARSANSEMSVQALYQMAHTPELQATEVRCMK